MRPARLLGAVGCVATLGGCDLAPPYHAADRGSARGLQGGDHRQAVGTRATGPWQPAHPADAAPRGPLVGGLRRSRVEPARSSDRSRQPDPRRHPRRLRSGTRLRARRRKRASIPPSVWAAPYRPTNNQVTARYGRPINRATMAQTRSMRRPTTKWTSGAGSAIS